MRFKGGSAPEGSETAHGHHRRDEEKGFDVRVEAMTAPGAKHEQLCPDAVRDAKALPIHLVRHDFVPWGQTARLRWA